MNRGREKKVNEREYILIRNTMEKYFTCVIQENIYIHLEAHGSQITCSGLPSVQATGQRFGATEYKTCDVLHAMRGLCLLLLPFFLLFLHLSLIYSVHIY